MQIKSKTSSLITNLRIVFFANFFAAVALSLLALLLLNLKFQSIPRIILIDAVILSVFIITSLRLSAISDRNIIKNAFLQFLSAIFIGSVISLVIITFIHIEYLDTDLIEKSKLFLSTMVLLTGLTTLLNKKTQQIDRNLLLQSKPYNKDNFSTSALTLAAIVTLSFIARIFYLETSNSVNFEKGLAVYDFNLMLQGLVPIRDFLAREPIPMLFEGFFSLMFGTSNYEIPLYALEYVLSAVLLSALLTDLQFSPRAKTIAFFLFYLSAFGLFKSNLLVLIFLLFNLIIFFKAIKPCHNKYIYLILGLSLGLLLHTYRAYIFLFVVETVFIFTSQVQKPTLSEIFQVYVPWVLLLYLPSLYFVLCGSFSDLQNTYQIDKLLVVSALPLIFSVLWKNKVITRLITHRHFKGSFYFSLFIISIVSLLYLNPEMLNIKIGVIGQFYRYSAALILLFVLGSFSIFAHTKYRYLSIMCVSLILILSYLGIGAPSRGPSSQLMLGWQNILMTTILLAAAATTRLKYPIIKTGNLVSFCFYYVIILFAISNYYNEWLDGYFGNYFLIFVIIGSISLSEYLKQKKIMFRVVCAFFIITNIFSVMIILSENKIVNINVATSVAGFDSALEYLHSELSETDTILTTTPWYLTKLDHKQKLHLPHPIVYSDPPNNLRFKNIVTAQDLETLLRNDQIEFIVADQRFKSLFLGNRYPEMKSYILTNYSIKMSADNGQILVYRRISNTE